MWPWTPGHKALVDGLMELIHHIYVDYENVQKIQVPLITGNPVTLTLVLGSRQDTLPVELIKELLIHAPQVRLVETKVTGKNALDFVLACELGGMCAMQPKAAYHIISKDKGFDAVIGHLHDHGICVLRHERFDAVPALGISQTIPEKGKKVIPATLDARVEFVLGKLARQLKNRPAKLSTLKSSIHAHFGKELSETEVEEIIARLVSLKKVAIMEKGAMTYHLE